MTDQDRIRLAEARGWTRYPDESDHNFDKWMPPDFGDHYDERDAVLIGGLPDPFTDANDDYQVLVWVRETWQPNSIYNSRAKRFVHLLAEPGGYQIGDYARAALSVIQRPEEAGKVLGDE